MKADTYILVRILQKKDNTIDEIKVIDIDNNQENLEKKISAVHEDVMNDKWQNYLILNFGKEEIKLMNKEFGSTITYSILKKQD